MLPSKVASSHARMHACLPRTSQKSLLACAYVDSTYARTHDAHQITTWLLPTHGADYSSSKLQTKRHSAHGFVTSKPFICCSPVQSDATQAGILRLGVLLIYSTPPALVGNYVRQRVSCSFRKRIVRQPAGRVNDTPASLAEYENYWHSRTISITAPCQLISICIHI